MPRPSQGRPVVCPHCGTQAGRPNGRRPSVARGLMQQFRCANCGRQWSVPTDWREPLLWHRRNHVSEPVLLKGMALVVRGLPMSAVEKLLGIKAETLRKKLTQLLEDDLWEMLDRVLEERFRVPRRQRTEFQIEVVERLAFEPEAPIFRDWGRRLRTLGPSDRQAAIRAAARLVGRPVMAFIGRAFARRRATDEAPPQ
jgi:transposase-like protein